MSARIDTHAEMLNALAAWRAAQRQRGVAWSKVTDVLSHRSTAIRQAEDTADAADGDLAAAYDTWAAGEPNAVDLLHREAVRYARERNEQQQLADNFHKHYVRLHAAVTAVVNDMEGLLPLVGEIRERLRAALRGES